MQCGSPYFLSPENPPSDTSNGAPLCGVTYPQLGSQCDYTLIDYHASQQIWIHLAMLSGGEGEHFINKIAIYQEIGLLILNILFSYATIKGWKYNGQTYDAQIINKD